MKRVLYMHGGSGNHGCEAIVRTTSVLLDGPENVVLWSLSREEDEKYKVSECVEKIIQSEEIRRYSASYFEALFRRKIRREAEANLHVFLRDQFKDAAAFSIGGDIYCYPWSAKQNVQFNREIRKHSRKTILWGCSVSQEAVTSEVKEDLAAYDLITAREQISYQLLKAINPQTVQVADPAFLLAREDLPLPSGFVENNTVGINISPLIMDYVGDNSIILENYRGLIHYILSKTDMGICLIPHVVWPYNDDHKPIQALFDEFADSGRVSMIKDGNCMQLKGFIARCRFFVGARTHATIAAYSSCVPTLVAGYSVKSRGIARDLFGTDEGYVIPVQSLFSPDDLTNQFQWLEKTEMEQREKLKNRIPDYVNEARKSANAFNMIVR